MKLTSKQIKHAIFRLTLSSANDIPYKDCEKVVAYLKSLLPKRKKGK